MTTTLPVCASRKGCNCPAPAAEVKEKLALGRREERMDLTGSGASNEVKEAGNWMSGGRAAVGGERSWQLGHSAASVLALRCFWRRLAGSSLKNPFSHTLAARRLKFRPRPPGNVEFLPPRLRPRLVDSAQSARISRSRGQPRREAKIRANLSAESSGSESSRRGTSLLSIPALLKSGSLRLSSAHHVNLPSTRAGSARPNAVQVYSNCKKGETFFSLF